MNTRKTKAIVSIVMLAAVTTLAGCAEDAAILPDTGGSGAVVHMVEK